MEDDDYQDLPPREWWDYAIDRRVVTESKARVRGISLDTQRRLFAELDAALASFAREIKYWRGSISAAGRTSIQWHPNDKDIHHTGRAYTDIDILSSQEFQNLGAFKSLRRKLHRSPSRALAIAASLLVIRDAKLQDGFSVRLASDLIANIRPIEQRALARGEQTVERIGLAGRNKRTEKSKKKQAEVRAVYLSFPFGDSAAAKMRALEQRFPDGPKSSFLYSCTADLRAAERRKKALAQPGARIFRNHRSRKKRA